MEAITGRRIIIRRSLIVGALKWLQIIAYDLRTGSTLKSDRRAKLGNTYEGLKCYTKDLGYYLESHWKILNTSQPCVLETSSGSGIEHELWVRAEKPGEMLLHYPIISCWAESRKSWNKDKGVDLEDNWCWWFTGHEHEVKKECGIIRRGSS